MFDEMRGSGDAVRPAYAELSQWLTEVKPDVLDFRRREAELLFRRIGITFAVYGDPEAQERLIPFDVIPRIISAKEWETVAARPRTARQSHQRLHQGRLWPPRDFEGRHRSGGSGVSKSGVSSGDERPEGAARYLRPYRRHRHRAARRRHLLRARGQCAHAVRRLLHAGEPRDHVAAVSGAVLALPRRAGRELSGRAFGNAEIGGAAVGVVRAERRAVDARASTIPPITSIRSSPTSSASNWSKAAISSSKATSSICARPKD